MADEIVYKKMYRKADAHLKDTIPVAHGKKSNQKMKPYAILRTLSCVLLRISAKNVRLLCDFCATSWKYEFHSLSKYTENPPKSMILVGFRV